MNKVIITGRLTSDPEFRQTQSGISSATFTVAVDRPYQKDKEKQADFIRCMAWRGTAEFVNKYFFKGDPIEVIGSLRTGSYKDKNHSDVTHYTTDVMVSEVSFTQSKKSKDNSATGSDSNTGYDAGSNGYGDLGDFEEILSDGEVPF